MARGETTELVVTSDYRLMMVTREDAEVVIIGGYRCHDGRYRGYGGFIGSKVLPLGMRVRLLNDS